MPADSLKSQRILEIFLLVIVVALTALLYEMAGYKLIVLNLFYLPVVLAGFFLGRYHGGILALFCVIAASMVTAVDMRGFATFSSPLVVGLTVIMWGAVLGLTALLVGTLSDERNAKIVELHEAYVGVVEVLSRYLQSANPVLEARSGRVARLCQDVASQLRLSPKQIDDIRVAALLYDMGNLEITSRVIRKAVGNLEDDKEQAATSCTFGGAELVQSLASVLTGAMPLLVNQDQLDDIPTDDNQLAGIPTQLGVGIIRTVRTYVSHMDGDWGITCKTPQEALAATRDDLQDEADALVIDALEQVVSRESLATPVLV